MAFELRSPAFGQNETIPARYTCDGPNLSVPRKTNLPPRATKADLEEAIADQVLAEARLVGRYGRGQRG